MSTLQLAHASDDLHLLVVEWNKYPPHFRVITDDSRVRTYHSEEAALRAAKRLARKLNLILKLDRDPMPYKLMAKEFPEFDQETLPAIPATFTDSSWHNDACPSFVVEDIGLQIYIAEALDSERELQGGARFCVLDCTTISFDDLLQTDDWAEVIALVTKRRVEQEDQA
jgi:hypothetical protein